MRDGGGSGGGSHEEVESHDAEGGDPDYDFPQLVS